MAHFILENVEETEAALFYENKNTTVCLDQHVCIDIDGETGDFETYIVQEKAEKA